MLIVLVSFLILGLMLLLLFAEYWKSEKGVTLNKNAVTVSDITSQTVTGYNNSFKISDPQTVQLFLNTFSISSSIDIFITDLDGNIIMASQTGNNLDENLTNIPSDTVSQAIYNKNYFVTSDLEGALSNKYYISGVPLFYNDYGVSTPIGAVFTLSESVTVSSFIFDVLEVFLSAAIVALIWSFIASWFSASKIVKPLKDISDAARRFGDGDFSVRVKVERKDEIGDLAYMFNDMASSLENFEGVRRSFVSNLSHELRTPMTTISGFIDGILDGTVPPDKQDYYLQIVSDEIKRLARLVKSMRNLTKIDNSEITVNRTEFDLEQTISTIVAMFNNVIREKKIKIIGLNNSDRVIICADYDMIFQTIYNLFENATKFTNKEGYIEFNISQNDEYTNIKIKNSGIGIPYEELPMVFDKFYKVDKSRSLDVKGMGLGLYITKTIVELHDGTISVDSVPNEYCQFEIKLPK